MAWSLLAIPGVGTIATIAGWATKVVNNFRYLKGIDGVVTTQSGLIIDNSLGSEYLKLPLLTTAQTGTVLTAEGQMAHDSQTHRIKLHDGTAVRSLVSTVDVDDTPANGATTDPVSSNWAYDFINEFSAVGDIAYATAPGVWERLGIGTAGYRLRVNAGATAPEWAVTGQTMQFFVIPAYGLNADYGAHANHSGRVCNLAGDAVYFEFRLPNDFSTLTSAKIAFIPQTTGTFDWTVTTSWGANGEDEQAHTDSATADGQAATDDVILELDVSAALTGLAANDIVGMIFTSDVFTTTVALHCLGIDIKYT